MKDGFGSTILKAVLCWLVFEGLLMGWRTSPWAAVDGMPRWAVAITFGNLLSLIMLVVTWLFVRSDELSMFELGMVPSRKSLSRFVISLLVGCAFFGSFFLIYLGFTPIKLSWVAAPNWLEATLLAFLVMLILGVMEEIVFRGYFLRKLDRAVGVRTAIYLTSIAFGFYHGWTLDSLTGPAIWGLIYAVLAYWSRGLAIPIGFHVGVNLIQAFFSQKQKWVSGIWFFDESPHVAWLTIDQVNMGLRVVLLVIGVIMVEYYIRKVHKRIVAPQEEVAAEATG